MMRTFVAFTLPDDVANQIIDWQQANMPPGVFPEPVTNLHMTLAFLGETPDELVPHINDILGRLNASNVSIVGPTKYEEQAKLAFLTFEDQGGQEVWAQLNAELKELMGYEPQFSPWLPHTTVWRFAPDHKPNINPPLPNLSFSPTAVTLYQSVRNEGGGATYQHVSSMFEEPDGDIREADDLEHLEYVRKVMEENGTPLSTWKPANILDPIEKELDQTVYQGTTPRHSAQKFITDLYYRALDKEFGVDGKQWADLYLTGSLTTYQYSVTSDADVSVFPNYDLFWKTLNLDPDSVRKRLIHLSIEHIDGTFLPGTTHPLQFFVVPNGIHPHDLYKPGLRSAFDLHDKIWFQKPERDRVHDIAIEYPDLFKRAEDIGDKLTQMLDAGEDDAARELWHQIHQKRQLDQQAGLGDFCEGNIVYKYLLNEGIFDRIRSELGEYIAKTAVLDSQTESLLYKILRMTTGMNVDDPEFDKLALYWLVNENNDQRMTPEQAEQTIQEFRVKHQENLKWNDEQSRKFEDAMQRGRDDWEIQKKQLIAEYGPQANVVFHRFDKFKPSDAPDYDGDEGDMVDEVVDNGLSWKFITAEGYGTYVWGDYETGNYNGAFSHTDAMRDLKNLWSEEWPAVKANMGGGWIEKPALKEGDSPYQILVLGAESLDDSAILNGLGLSPQEATIERGGGFRMGKMADLWEDRVSTKVIYDFDNDTITLGTQATQATIPDSKIIGEYNDGRVTLYGVEKQWISPQYFHRLWSFSYPDKELKDVYYQREEGDVKLRTVRRPKRGKWQWDDNKL